MDEPEAIASPERSTKHRIAEIMSWGARTVGFFSIYGYLRSCIVKRKIAIIQYHRIDEFTSFPFSLTPVTPREFDRQMRYLHRKYHVISIEELSTTLTNLKALPPNTAVVTFDDGYRDVYLNAYPILKKYGLPATVFLTTGHIGTTSLYWWDKVSYLVSHTHLKTIEVDGSGAYRLGTPGERRWAADEITGNLKEMPEEKKHESIEKLVQQCDVDIPPDLGRELIMSWDDVKDMSRNGISFGAHTVNHPILTRIPLENARKEILGSKQHIEKEIEREVTTFCYPNGEPGDYNTDIEEILENSGFKCAVTLIPPAFVSPETPPYRLPRMPEMSGFDIFQLVMSGVYFDLVAAWHRLAR